MNRIDLGIDRQTIDPDVTSRRETDHHTIEPLWATVTV
jgi:hypothetical protein